MSKIRNEAKESMRNLTRNLKINLRARNGAERGFPQNCTAGFTESPRCPPFRVLSCLCGLCALFLCFSCSGAMGGNGPGKDTTGELSFDLPAETSDASGASTAVALYRLEMSSATGFEKESVCEPSAEPVTLQEVESGRWRITASALDADGTQLKTARRTVSLGVGETKHVSLGFGKPSAPAQDTAVREGNAPENDAPEDNAPPAPPADDAPEDAAADGAENAEDARAGETASEVSDTASGSVNPA